MIKDTSNARPSLKLGGTTLNWSGRWGVGGWCEGCVFYGTDVLLAVILSKEGCCFFRLSQQFCSQFIIVWFAGVILEREFT